MKTATPNLRTTEQNRKLWWLAGQLGLDREAMADVVLEFTEGRTPHTSELTFLECRELTEFLQKTLIPGGRSNSSTKGETERDMLDRKRKGVLRAIFRWLELRGVKASMEYVKAIACRAAKRDRFNDLTVGELTRVYAEFCRKQEAVGAMGNEIVEIARNN